jgi:Rv2632c-like
MTAAKQWHVEIFIDEHDDQRRTRAEARLHTTDDTHLTGVGTAHRNPADVEVPEIGDEVAAARALFALGHELLLAAAGDIEAVAHQKARLHI